MAHSEPSSLEPSDLSASEESDWSSPDHVCSCDCIGGELSDDEQNLLMTASSSSAVSRCTKSPSKSTSSQGTNTERGDTDLENPGREEEVIVADIELVPDSVTETIVARTQTINLSQHEHKDTVTANRDSIDPSSHTNCNHSDVIGSSSSPVI